MNIKSTNILCIYHGNCADGFGAAGGGGHKNAAGFVLKDSIRVM